MFAGDLFIGSDALYRVIEKESSHTNSGMGFSNCRSVCDAMTMSTSMTGLPAMPGTAVLPTCSIAIAASRTDGQIWSLSQLNARGQSGS